MKRILGVLKNEAFENILFKEFKFYNITKDIEMTLSDTLMSYFVKNKLLKNSEAETRQFIVDRIKRYRDLKTDKEAEEILKKDKIERGFDGLFSPLVFFEFAGFTLGDFNSFIRDRVKDFQNKKDLIGKLSKFIEYRNIIIHNLFSNRIDLEKEINEGLNLGLELKELLKQSFES